MVGFYIWCMIGAELLWGIWLFTRATKPYHSKIHNPIADCCHCCGRDSQFEGGCCFSCWVRYVDGIETYY